MRNKYKQRGIKNEKEKEKKELIIEKTINFDKEIHLSRSKSPKNSGNIMSKIDILNKFNKIFEKEREKKRENSEKNRINLRTVNRNNYNKNIILREIKTKGDNINSKLKILRHSSYSKFDNEESINKNFNNDENNINEKEKEEIKIIYNRENYYKEREREIEEEKKDNDNEKDNISINETKIKRNIAMINYVKKQPEKSLKNNINKKNKNIINENNKDNKEVNIYQMPNAEDFDTPKNSQKERINENRLIGKNQYESLNISPINLLMKKSKFKNDDNLLKKDEVNIIYDNNKKCSLLDKKINTKPKQSFQYLVHQANKNRNLSKSFHKYYESGARSREGSKMKNNNNEEILTEKKYKSRNKILGLIKSNKNRSVTNIYNYKEIKKELNEEKDIKNELNEEKEDESKNNINTTNISNNNNKNNSISSENHYIIKKIIINNNNSNFYNDKNKSKSNNNIINNNISNNINNNISNNKVIKNNYKDNKDNDSLENNKENNKNICIKNYILINNLKVVNNKNNNIDDRNKNEIIKKDSDNSYIISNEPQPNSSNNYIIDLEILYILGEKMRIIINRINNYQECKNE